tara:strand:+ start:163 stop:435 length:273 start_codon:yes stop_codon:yes gene_type:complete
MAETQKAHISRMARHRLFFKDTFMVQVGMILFNVVVKIEQMLPVFKESSVASCNAAHFTAFSMMFIAEDAFSVFRVVVVLLIVVMNLLIP